MRLPATIAAAAQVICLSTGDFGVYSVLMKNWHGIVCCLISSCLGSLTGCAPNLPEGTEEGIALFQQERYDEAIQVLKEVVQQDSTDALVHVYLQVAYNLEGDYERAILHGQRAVALDPLRTDTYHNLAYAYRRLDRYEEAVQSYRIVLELDSGDERARFQMGTILATMGRYEEAIEMLESTLEHNDGDGLIRRTLALCNMHLRQYTEAVEHLQRILQTEQSPSQWAEAHLYLGDVLYLMDDRDKALESYSAITPEMDGRSYRLAQHYIEALTTATEGRGKRQVVAGIPYPPRAATLRNLATCGTTTLHMVLDFWGDPVTHREIAVHTEPELKGMLPFAMYNFAIQRGYSGYFFHTEDMEGIKQIIDGGYPVLVSFLDPDAGGGHSVLVVGYDEVKRVVITRDVNHWIADREIPFDEFLTACRYYGFIGLLIVPRNVDPERADLNLAHKTSIYHSLRGGYYHSKGELEKAIDALEQAVALQTPLPAVYARLAIYYIEHGRKNQETKRYIKQAQEMGSSSGSALLNIGDYYYLTGEMEQSLVAYRKGIELYPESYSLRNRISRLYNKLRNYARAAEELNKAMELCRFRGRNCRDEISLIRRLALSYLFIEDYGRVIELHEQLLQQDASAKQQLPSLKTIAGLGMVMKRETVAVSALERLNSLLDEEDPQRAGWNTLLQAIRENGIESVGVKLEKDEEAFSFSFKEFFVVQL